MIIYFVLFFIPLFFYVFLNIDKEKKQKICFLSFFILFFILLIFKDESVGVDTKFYISTFNSMKNISWDNIFKLKSSEYGFYGFTYLCSKIFSSSQSYFFIIYCFILIITYIYYKKNSEDSIITILYILGIDTFCLLFSGIRQSIAISLCMLASFFLYEKNLKNFFRFLIIVFVATMFHESSLIFFFAYPLSMIRLRKKTVPFIFVSYGIIFALRTKILTFVMPYLPLKYQLYNYGAGGAYRMILLMILIIMLLFIFDRNMEDKKYYIWRNMVVLSGFIFIFSNIHFLAARFSYYYIIFLPLCMQKLFIKNSNNIVVKAIIICLGLIMFVNQMVSDPLEIIPYKFMF